MDWTKTSRRSFLKQFGAAGAAAVAAAEATALPTAQQNQTTGNAPADRKQAATREQRMQWWHEAKFGMFIHWGLYSVIGQHEWAKEQEGVPLLQYEILAKHFHPKPNAARDWARLAKRAGQKYMVMTTKHHEGFCNWDTKLTDYNAAQQGPGRDLVREFVEAARAEGLHVGFYYSLMDWHHPDGAICKTDEAARRRFVDYTHGLIRELMTNYGKIDVLWYDVDWPLNAEQWESERMNEMVFSLQPEIIVNNRNGLPGDFSTPEQHIQASEVGRAWETCMTLNESWGFNRADDQLEDTEDDRRQPDHLRARRRQLSAEYRAGAGWFHSAAFSGGSGNRGQMARHQRKATTVRSRAPGSSVPMRVAIIPGAATRSTFTSTIWPGHTPAAEWLDFYKPEVVVAIGGLKPKVLSAKVLKTGQKVEFTQDEFNFRLTGLPMHAPDQPATVIEVECDGEPTVDHGSMRPLWPRHKVGISV